MPKFLIERTVPGASKLSAEALQSIAATSCDAMSSLKEPYTWHETFVAGDKLYCVHSAASEDVVREHSRRGGFPVDRVTEIVTSFGPATVCVASAA